MDLYIHSPIRLHGVVLNSLSTGTILPLPSSAFTRQALDPIQLQNEFLTL
jgi:hypothetical protein